jgi:hypothetical protein
MKKTIISICLMSGLVLSGLVINNSVNAQVNPALSTSSLQSQLQNLMVMLRDLERKVELMRPVGEMNLNIGMSSADVSRAQTILARDKSIYPEGLVTGYYGTLTKEAVGRFQSKNNLAVTGVIDWSTWKKLNANEIYSVPKNPDPRPVAPVPPIIPRPFPVQPPGGEFCSSDAFICADGTAVGRTLPGCKFVCPVIEFTPTIASSSPIIPIICPMDAKLCPDGSAVGRTGTSCEFQQCPAPSLTPDGCPMVKFMCADGSMVGASGPRCEYICPTP